MDRPFFKKTVQQILNAETNFGRNDSLSNKNIIIEYTDPNPFKQFHIGHLMSNSIGEAIARILEWNGAKITRVCYQGDVGMHVAKAIWGIKNIEEPFPSDSASIDEKTAYLGKVYTFGANKYDDDGTPITVIAGEVCDQAALHGLLAKIRDLGLPLLAVNRIKSNKPYSIKHSSQLEEA